MRASSVTSSVLLTVAATVAAVVSSFGATFVFPGRCLNGREKGGAYFYEGAERVHRLAIHLRG